MAKPAAFAGAALLALSACGGSNGGSSASGDASGGGASGSVSVDGSSTVGPLSTAAAELFRETNPNINVTVATSGTGGGFEKFCRGETDMNDASRPIKDEEAAACKTAGVTYSELTVATDALTVVVNPENTWAKCLTLAQLKAIWEPNSKVSNWNQVDPSFPDVPLKLFGPGTDSGTFDFFTDQVNGEEGASRTDFSPSEDDNVTVQGVEGNKGGLGYFGYTYFEENADKLTAVEVDGGSGCVAPSAETAQNGTYAPLSRPLFIYPSVGALKNNAAFKPFLEYYVTNDEQIAKDAKFIPLNEDQKKKLTADFDKLVAQAG